MSTTLGIAINSKLLVLLSLVLSLSVLSAFTNVSGLGGGAEVEDVTTFGSGTIPSFVSGVVLLSNGSPVGGTLIPLDTTSLLIAGIQTSFSILIVLALVGTGTFMALLYSTKKNNS